MKPTLTRTLKASSLTEISMKNITTIAKYSTILTSLTYAFSPAVYAQQLDYGSYEALFGEPVTTGATGTPQRASDVGVNMTILTQEDIQRSGARNLAEVMRRVQGMEVRRISGQGYTSNIRGFVKGEVDRLRVLVNGRDTFKGYNGSTVWSTIPVQLAEIRQIEVVRGPATALYGANAVSGVINIVTYSPLYDDVSNISASYGTQDAREASMVHTFKLPNNKGGIRVSGNIMEMDRFKTEQSSQEALVLLAAEQRTVSLDSLIQLNDDIQFGAEITHVSASSVEPIWSLLPNGVEFSDTTYKVSLGIDSSLGLTELRAYQNDMLDSELIFNTFRGSTETLPKEASTFVVEGSHVKKISEKSTMRLSAGFRDDRVLQFGDDSPASGTGNVGLKDFYVGALWSYQAQENLSLASSLRMDWYKAYRNAIDLYPIVPFQNSDYGNFSEWSANFSALYQMSNTDSLRFMFGRAIDTPNASELGGWITLLPQFQFNVGGHPNVKNGTVTEFEIRYQKDFSSNILGAVSLIYQDNQELPSPAWRGDVFLPDPDVNIHRYWGSANNANAEMFGLEIDLSGKAENGFDWALYYRFMDVNDNTISTAAPDVDALFGTTTVHTLDLAPKHSAKAILGYSGEKFSFDLVTYYNSKFKVPFFNAETLDVKAKVNMNANIAYKFTEDIKVNLAGENLIGGNYSQAGHPSMKIEPLVRLGVSLNF